MRGSFNHHYFLGAKSSGKIQHCQHALGCEFHLPNLRVTLVLSATIDIPAQELRDHPLLWPKLEPLQAPFPECLVKAFDSSLERVLLLDMPGTHLIPKTYLQDSLITFSSRPLAPKCHSEGNGPLLGNLLPMG